MSPPASGITPSGETTASSRYVRSREPRLGTTSPIALADPIASATGLCARAVTRVRTQATLPLGQWVWLGWLSCLRSCPGLCPGMRHRVGRRPRAHRGSNMTDSRDQGRDPIAVRHLTMGLNQVVRVLGAQGSLVVEAGPGAPRTRARGGLGVKSSSSRGREQARDDGYGIPMGVLVTRGYFGRNYPGREGRGQKHERPGGSLLRAFGLIRSVRVAGWR